jgi:hypothetical protein
MDLFSGGRSNTLSSEKTFGSTKTTSLMARDEKLSGLFASFKF